MLTDEPVVTGRTDRRTGRRRLPLLLVAVIVVLIAAHMALFAVHRRQPADPQGTSALIAARDAVSNVLSYDYTQLDKSLAAAEKVSTPEFAKQYKETTARAVRGPATEVQAVVEADVRDAGVSQVHSDRVEVIGFVNQATTSTRYPNGKIEPARVRVQMQKLDGTWKLDDIQAL